MVALLLMTAIRQEPGVAAPVMPVSSSWWGSSIRNADAAGSIPVTGSNRQWVRAHTAKPTKNNKVLVSRGFAHRKRFLKRVLLAAIA
jgi:hypothetical protein